jgi:hypothetical protein
MKEVLLCVFLLLTTVTCFKNGLMWKRVVPRSDLKPKGRVDHLWMQLSGSKILMYGGSDVNTGLPIDDGGVYYYDYITNVWNFVETDPNSPGPGPKSGFCYWKSITSRVLAILYHK